MKKLPNHIQAELHQLRAIKPEADWLLQTKQNLLAELPFVEDARRISYRALAVSSFRQSLTKLAWQPIGVLMLMFGVIAGPSIAAVNAAKGSLPGDALYPVKRSLERARLSFTFSNSKRAQLEVDLVSNRLHEIQRLTTEQAPSATRQQNIVLAVEELKKDTASVKTRLDAAKQGTSIASNLEAVALARIIDEKTESYQETLQATIETSGGALTQAISTVQDVTINALDVLAQKGEDQKTALTDEELKTRVEKEHALVKNTATALQTQLATLISVSAVETDSAQPAEPAAPAVSAPATTEVPAASAEKSSFLALQKRLGSEVYPRLAYADELIKLQDFGAALDTVNEVNKNLDAISHELDTLISQQAPAEPQKDESADEASAPVETPSEDAPTETDKPAEEPKTEAPAANETPTTPASE